MANPLKNSIHPLKNRAARLADIGYPVANSTAPKPDTILPVRNKCQRFEIIV